MKFGKLLLTLAMVSCSWLAFAQQGQTAVARAPISDVKVQAQLMTTPYLEIKNETSAQYKTREADKNTAKHWIAIVVDFKTNEFKGGTTRWGRWLDNVSVKVDAMIPACDDRGNIGWGVVSGEVVLESVSVDNNTHSVCVFLPPDVIYRYFYFSNLSSPATFDYKKEYSAISTSLKKYAGELPIRATVTYGSRITNGLQNCGKNFYASISDGAKNGATDFAKKSSAVFLALLKPADGASSPSEAETVKLFRYIEQQKINPTSFKYLEDALEPISKTPFIFAYYDRFESTKESTGK